VYRVCTGRRSHVALPSLFEKDQAKKRTRKEVLVLLIFERITRAGYTSHKTVMKDYVAKMSRRIAATAVQRFETEPGRQA